MPSAGGLSFSLLNLLSATMRTILSIFFSAFAAAAFADEPKLIDAPKPPDGFPKFKVQEIDTGLKIGYAVTTSDIDGDAKPDIVVVDQHKVVWYQNPTWKKRVILDGKTKPDNVCITALDIDGDKLPELVLGAAWKPFDTKTPGTLQWLKRGKTLDDEWSMHEIPCDEPTVHRVRAIDLNGDGKPEVVMAPLMGRDATKEKNWMDGRPVRILAYKVPAKDPEKKESWKPEVLNDELHVVHNFELHATTRASKSGDFVEHDLFTASYEGVTHLWKSGDAFVVKDRDRRPGEQSNPLGSRGSSEVAALRHKSWPRFNWVAAVEPWHGNSLAFYRERLDGELGSSLDFVRTIIDDQLRWGHAVKFGEFIPGGRPLLVLGVRDNPTKDDKFKEQRGVRLYRSADDAGTKWDRYILEDGGVAVEDLTVADLNGDGKLDIVAVGRATGNARIYWNQGK